LERATVEENGDYEYEVFISYRRDPPISDWVRSYFHEQLTQWLAAARPEAPRVFIDQAIDTGDAWPERLRRALLRSCFLVGVWSPSYFISKWCTAELATMMAREQALSMRTQAEPRGLVFPVNFTERRYFPEYVAGIESHDFSKWAYTAPAFNNSDAFLEFQAEIKDLAETIAQRLDDPPPWQSDWPVETPAVSTGHDVPLPKL
jgi:TIR domain